MQPYPFYDQFIASPYFQLEQKINPVVKAEQSESVTGFFPARNKERRFQKLISNDLDQNIQQDQEIETDLVRSFRFDLHPEEKLALTFLN